MKKLLGIAAALLLALASMPADSQVSPAQFASGVSLAAAATATGAQPAVRAPGANKTFQVVSSTTAGTGTASVTVQGSNDGAAWDSIATLSVTTSTAATSTSTTTLDRYLWLRANVTALTGTGAQVSLTAGF